MKSLSKLLIKAAAVLLVCGLASQAQAQCNSCNAGYSIAQPVQYSYAAPVQYATQNYSLGTPYSTPLTFNFAQNVTNNQTCPGCNFAGCGDPLVNCNHCNFSGFSSGQRACCFAACRNNCSMFACVGFPPPGGPVGPVGGPGFLSQPQFNAYTPAAPCGCY